MCLSPITIPNPTKYISTKHADQFMLQVPCGHCAECEQNNSSQWFYRAWYEFEDCLKAGGFVLFDTLTYDNEHLPHISDFMSISKENDFPCFNHQHVRKFRDLLTKRVKRAGYDDVNIRVFLSSEYGVDDRYTHRPHYHVLFYVTGNISPLVLSRFVGQLWIYGRTDGLPYQTDYYVTSKNVITRDAPLATRLRTCNYVTKYVQKSCEFQSEIDKRINYVMNEIVEKMPEGWSETEHCRRLRLRLKRHCNQFHRQSQHFGESALQDIDFEQLKKDGCLWMPSVNHVKIAVPLPTYYKRKLFYDLVKFNGSRYWQLNDLGKEYRQAREQVLIDKLKEKFDCLCMDYNIKDVDTVSLSRYVYKRRGRFIGLLPESTLETRYNDIDYISYITCSDKEHFGQRGIVRKWLGDTQQGYISHTLESCLTLPAFISKFVFFDPAKEKELNKLYSYTAVRNKAKQDAYVARQRLANLYCVVS